MLSKINLSYPAVSSSNSKSSYKTCPLSGRWILRQSAVRFVSSSFLASVFPALKQSPRLPYLTATQTVPPKTSHQAYTRIARSYDYESTC
jgi:hypothetical protein